MRTDREKSRIEAAFAHAMQHVIHSDPKLQADAHIKNALYLGVEHVARQAILRDAEAHHAARHRTCFQYRYFVPETPQVIGSRKTRRARADDEDPFSDRRHADAEFPAFAHREVTEKALDGVNVDRLIELPAIAGIFAGVITHASHDRREGIVANQLLPGVAIIAGLRVVEPALDVFAGGAGVIARRQAVDVYRTFGAPRAGTVRQARSGIQRDRKGLFHLSPAARTCGCCDRPSTG